jgi:hypothetical protein
MTGGRMKCIQQSGLSRGVQVCERLCDQVGEENKKIFDYNIFNKQWALILKGDNTISAL